MTIEYHLLSYVCLQQFQRTILEHFRQFCVTYFAYNHDSYLFDISQLHELNPVFSLLDLVLIFKVNISAFFYNFKTMGVRANNVIYDVFLQVDIRCRKSSYSPS